MHNRDGWLAWRSIVDGDAPPGDVEVDLRFLLEEPTPYELRRILRPFEGRDEALARLESVLTGQHSLDPDAVASTAMAHLAQLAEACADNGVDWPEPDGEIEVRLVDERPESATQWDVMELIVDARSAAAAPSLRIVRNAVGGMFSDFLLVEHVTGSLQPPSVAFPAYAQLRTVGREAVMIDQRTAAVFSSAPTAREGYTPYKLPWLSDDELADHRADEDAAASAGSTSPSALVGSESWFARELVALRPELDPAGIDLLISDANHKVRFALTTREDLTTEQAVALAGDPHARVQLGAMKLSVLPPAMLAALADDLSNGAVGELALRNTSTPIDAVERAAESTDPERRAAVATRSDLSDELGMLLAADGDRTVRLAAARNANLVPAALELLASNDDRSISRTADRTRRRLEQAG